MIVLSNDVKVRGAICQGQVYNFSPEEGVLNHYYVVLNKNPKRDSETYLAPFTSKKESVLRFITIKKIDPRTFVTLTKGECSFLPDGANSGIDCNRLVYTDISTLVGLINNSNGGCNYPQIHDSLLERVKQGVMLSPLVKPIIKKDGMM